MLNLKRVGLAGMLAAFLHTGESQLAHANPIHTSPDSPPTYQDLVTLHTQWRAFERAPLRNGAPDYSQERLQKAYAGDFQTLRQQLDAFDIQHWPIHQQVDWHLIRAEMNGYAFNYHVLKPWTRDPAFYRSVWEAQSDVPAHEGPTHHGLIEMWTYKFPLSTEAEVQLTRELSSIPPLLKQAKEQLTGDAQELWVAGIRDLENQEKFLGKLYEKLVATASKPLLDAINAAKTATKTFIVWLKAEAPKKHSPSGIGKDHYTWYLQNVHLVPLSWEDEVRLLQRELDRAWTSLKLEEQRNRDVPPMVAAKNAAEYDKLAEKAVDHLLDFLAEKHILHPEPFLKSALLPHMGAYTPKSTRNFFMIGAHYDPTPLFTHWYHWWDLARLEQAPLSSPIRQAVLLYNIFDSRAEGTATGVEEMFMHAGLYDQRPHSREIVWIMLCQRAARGLGSLYAHANQMTMKEAGTVHMEWTPRGWMKTEPELLQFEQHLYLRQPGYGTSYVTGKYLLERLIARYAKQQEDKGVGFELDTFFADFNALGIIPMSLIQYEMTGSAEGLETVLRTSPAPWDSLPQPSTK